MNCENVSTAVDRDDKAVATGRVILAGHPNVGKSVLFNALTGKYVIVSNYAGTTVDVTSGLGRAGGRWLQFVDSPGINSLIVSSDEEKVTRGLVLEGADIVIQVADMKNLARTLALTLELAELEIPMVLCLNMKDEALSRGYLVDIEALSKTLGIPVVATVATTREGIADLADALSRAAKPLKIGHYNGELARAIKEAKSYLPLEIGHLAPLFLANHTTPQDLAAPMRKFLTAETIEKLSVIRRRFVRPVDAVLTEWRQQRGRELAGEVLSRPDPSRSPRVAQWLDLLGRWCLKPWPGFLIAALVLFGLYEFVGVFAAQVCVNFLEETVFGRYLNPAAESLVKAAIPWPFIQGMLVGDYGAITMALTYAFALILPIVSAFFLALGFLEDSGYLPRLSVLTDRVFRLVGLNGKAVFPVILGLGCGTMAMLTTRILDTRKEKLLASFLLALAVPCSAQLGVILAMASGLSLWVMAIWLAVLSATLLGVGAAASRLVPGASSPLLLEIPPMRGPSAANLFKKIWVRLKWYTKEVVPLFIYGTLALYFLDFFGWLAAIERWCAPVVTGFLGLPEKATESFLIGFLRRDYGAAGLYQLQREGLLNIRQSAVAIVAITLFMPCIAQWMMTVKERGLKVTVAISAFVIGYALAAAGILNQALLWAGW